MFSAVGMSLHIQRFEERKKKEKVLTDNLEKYLLVIIGFIFLTPPLSGTELYIMCNIPWFLDA